MKDLYQVLGLSKEATPDEIKKAYRNSALANHPDRGGNAETMVLLNEAYETLSDPAKKRKFDADYKVYKETDVEEPHENAVDSYLNPGNAQPFSQSFKEEHIALIYQYRQTPLTAHSEVPGFKPFEPGIYKVKSLREGSSFYHDIFTFINVMETSRNRSKSAEQLLQEGLSSNKAIALFTEFLTGDYFGNELDGMLAYLQAGIENKQATVPDAPELQLYEGIYEIMLMARQIPAEQCQLIMSIKKITDFARATSDLVLQSTIPLFYNQFFRNLYAYALHLYWRSGAELFAVETLKQFDGRLETKALLSVLRDRLATSAENENLTRLIQYLKLLYILENDLHKASDSQPSAADYRDKAFHLLDWIPAMLGKADRQIIVNIFLQIGINFQQAAHHETELEVKMADERIALKMYLTAVGIGHHSTPDIEMYANTQALKYISHFQFHDATSSEVIPALQKRMLIIADVFPFFQELQPNVAFLRHENKTLHLMRRLLDTMILILEFNKTHRETIPLNHSAVTILYQAYEACLKNWYREEHDPAAEQKFRLDLMDELLFENGWTFLDVEQNIDFPYVMVDRNKKGWLRPTRSLPYVEDTSFVKYRAINGAELNYSSGEITFFMEPWNPSRPPYEKLFTLFDLQEMLQKKLMGAIFSLDPVASDKPYHPFNSMRFAPSQLCDSDLLNTMLLTDYTLKFLTTGQEVQGRYPFQQRPLDSMIKHLPAYLRKIIEDFHQENHPGATHRFWIEAEEIAISLPDAVLEHRNIARIGLDNIRMVVKKHRMERDIHRS